MTFKETVITAKYPGQIKSINWEGDCLVDWIGDCRYFQTNRLIIVAR